MFACTPTCIGKYARTHYANAELHLTAWVNLPVDPIMGNLFFQLWAFLVLMILLNIFVAILMDGYALAQEEGVNAANQNGQEEPESVMADVSKFMVCAHEMSDVTHGDRSARMRKIVTPSINCLPNHVCITMIVLSPCRKSSSRK